jgi:putative transposase
MDWKHLLAYITGTVDQELLLRNAYLVAENRILRNQLQDRVRLRGCLESLSGRVEIVYPGGHGDPTTIFDRSQ